MSNIITVSDVLGRRVVAADDATEIGAVKAFVLERDASRVRRLHVSGSKRSAELVDWGRITGVGEDAVMVSSIEDVHETVADTDDAFVKGDIDVIGARVLDTSGYELGEVTDLHIDADTGAVVAAMTTGGRVEAERLRSLGSHALVVDSES